MILKLERCCDTVVNFTNLATWILCEYGVIFLLQRVYSIYGIFIKKIWVDGSSIKEGTAEEMLKWVRSHWGIENSLHWVLDVVFKEDASRIHKGYGAQNMAVLRHLALNIINQEESCVDSVKGKQQCAAWANNYMMKLLNVFAYV